MCSLSRHHGWEKVASFPDHRKPGNEASDHENRYAQRSYRPNCERLALSRINPKVAVWLGLGWVLG